MGLPGCTQDDTGWLKRVDKRSKKLKLSFASRIARNLENAIVSFNFSWKIVAWDDRKSVVASLWHERCDSRTYKSYDKVSREARSALGWFWEKIKLLMGLNILKYEKIF